MAKIEIKRALHISQHKLQIVIIFLLLLLSLTVETFVPYHLSIANMVCEQMLIWNAIDDTKAAALQ